MENDARKIFSSFYELINLAEEIILLTLLKYIHIPIVCDVTLFHYLLDHTLHG